ncbi:hypothetical protein CLOM_g5528 [Closterium sp. NIES-68]|nr:hypothetical protein CLOM_g5528 [Closterium sp. NIES-68]GJP84766.1 hypothetical protein CLOP_g14821 [Closterium sp. NIES-67]
MGAVSAADAESSRQRFVDFLQRHKAYELLPESGKVVALDVALPVKQAFHALYEQGVPAAPLWDSERQEFVGMLSASDFISILTQLHCNSAALSEEELETHTIAAWKEEKLALATPLDAPHTPARRPLIYVGPDDTLRKVAEVLLTRGLAMVPVLFYPEARTSSSAAAAANAANAAATSVAEAPPPPQLLHLASLAGILKCVAKHFRHVAGSLPLLSQPLGALPIGTWAAESGRPNTRPIVVLQTSMSLFAALSLLLQAGVSSLPVVDESGALIDIYARSDITTLAKDHVYARLNIDEFTVGQALQYRQDAGAVGAAAAGGTRCHMCLQSDSLRVVVERLAMPGVRRLVCVEAGSRRIQGIVSLSDLFHFLLS